MSRNPPWQRSVPLHAYPQYSAVTPLLFRLLLRRHFGGTPVLWKVVPQRSDTPPHPTPRRALRFGSAARGPHRHQLRDRCRQLDRHEVPLGRGQ